MKKLKKIFDLITVNGDKEELTKLLEILAQKHTEKMWPDPECKRQRVYAGYSFSNGIIFIILKLLDSDTCPICGKQKIKTDEGFEHLCTQKNG